MLKTHNWRTASLVMALTAIMGLALPALGDDGSPFIRGHYMLTGTEAEPVADDCLNRCQVTGVDTGQATHLGRFTRLSCVVVNPDDGSAEGPSEFIAANGDTLCAEVKGLPTEKCGIATTEVIPICGTFKFTGGTGQFSDASGKTVFAGVITFDESGSPHIAVAFAGTIQY